MDYVFPAIFHANENGTYTITFPDLTGCISEGKSFKNAMYMAGAALKQWLELLITEKMDIPEASQAKDIEIDIDEFVNYIYAEVKSGKAVRRNVSIPQWMDEKASESGISLSRVLQDALGERFA